MKTLRIESQRSRIFFTLGLLVCACILGIFAVAAHADEPTTIIRHRGKAGLAERLESKGKTAKENTVRVRLSKTIGDVVIQERVVVKGSDVFEAKPKPERKAVAKDRPQPASKKVGR